MINRETWLFRWYHCSKNDYRISEIGEKQKVEMEDKCRLIKKKRIYKSKFHLNRKMCQMKPESAPSIIK